MVQYHLSLGNIWPGSSAGQSAGLSRQRSRVRAPSRSPYMGAQLSWESICLTSRGSQVRALLVPLFCRHGSMAEQLICNQQVVGSTPTVGFYMDGFPSGQREQTVNLLASPSKVRILLHPLTTLVVNFISRGGAARKLVGLITRRSQVQILSPLLCLDSSVGRAED